MAATPGRFINRTKIFCGESEVLGGAVHGDGDGVEGVIANNHAANRLPVGGGAKRR